MMAENSKISWTDHTINFWWGCEKIAPGCAHCYAEAWSKRYGLKLWGPDSVRKRIKGAIPLARKLNKQAERDGVRLKVFSNSMSDFFEDFTGNIVNEKAVKIGEGLDILRREAFRLIDATPHLDWQILTKRPENVRRMWLKLLNGELDLQAMVRPNVWLGTSISDQATADKAIPELLKCRDLAPVLFLSVEPLLGPVDLRGWLDDNWPEVDPEHGRCLDWVIVGGESGPGARPCHVDWIRRIVRQCESASVPCFVKQLGFAPVCREQGPMTSGADWDSGAGEDRAILSRLTDPKGGDWLEWPSDLRVRQFPNAMEATWTNS